MLTTQEIKQRVICKINQLSDNELLLNIDRIIDSQTIDNNIYCLSDTHKSTVNEAIRQIKNGQYQTNEQANKEIDEWLNK